MKKTIIVSLIIFIVGLVIIFLCNFSTEYEQNVERGGENQIIIEPEEEIPEEVNYETSIKLYFADATSGVLVSEERRIDARMLIDNPYLFVIKLLIEGPNSDSLKRVIPEDTKVNNVALKNGTLNVDLSEEFLNSTGTDSIYSIVNTLSEFNEVDRINFLINGEAKEGLRESFVKKD